jgi:RimJ/RimL family protein N-acetyltransferase
VGLPSGPVATVGRMASSAPVIRPATAADIPAIIAIREQVAGESRWIGRELPLPDDLADRLTLAISDDSGVYFVADVDGLVVGDGGLHTPGTGHAELFMAIVDGQRGRGIGKQLLAASLDWARGRPELHKVLLQVWPHNDRAIALYRHAGFIVEGYRHQHWRRANGDLWDVIEMGLVLDR